MSGLTRCDRTPAWAQLQAHFGSGAQPARAFDLHQAFAADPARFEALSQQAPHVFADLSKNLIDAPTEAASARPRRAKYHQGIGLRERTSASPAFM